MMGNLPASCENKVYDGQARNLSLYFNGIVGKRILDVGCGTGNLGAALKRRENECYGITISKSEAELAKSKLTQVIIADIETMQELPFPEHFFDVVIFADILEHLKNPPHPLQLVKRYLKPQGLMITSIPNIANIRIRLNLLCGRFNYELVGILDNTHLRFFTMKTAKELLISAGYIIQDIKFTNSDWRLPRPLRWLVSFREWEIQRRLTHGWPKLFATQFIFYTTPSSNGFLTGEGS